MTPFLLLAAVALLAYANGANDNGKGVATLIGSGILSERASIGVALVATALGAIVSPILGVGLFKAFSGKGLVPEALVADPVFPLAVALGGAATVLLFTALRMPVSTTHALLGALLGAGLMMVGTHGLSIRQLGYSFLLPLAASPLMAAAATFLIAPFFLPKLLRGKSSAPGGSAADCLCVGESAVAPAGGLGMRGLGFMTTFPFVAVGRHETCASTSGIIWMFRIPPAKDFLHIASGATLSFARGLNDTPKIAALLITGVASGPRLSAWLVTAAMAVGGWLAVCRVTRTISHHITPISPADGFAGNLATSALVLLASPFGLPVSTTHVSVGAIFGIGARRGRLEWKTVAGILSAWLVTLPAGAALGAGFAWMAGRLG